jgi:c-di-GMP-binding flagellar brake protein YcgR
MRDRQDGRRGGAERRQVRRVPFIAAVRQEIGQTTRLALAQDLGPDGIKLKQAPGESAPREGTVRLAFELPDGGGLVSVEGCVVFETDGQTDPYRQAGVRFLTLAPDDRRRISCYVESATPPKP